MFKKLWSYFFERKIYLVYENSGGCWRTFTLVEIFSTRKKAEQFAEEMTKKLPPEEKPEFDDYGPVTGTFYEIEAKIIR